MILLNYSNFLLEHHAELQRGAQARRLFPLRVPVNSFAHEKGDPNDPLLLQVLTAHAEFTP